MNMKYGEMRIQFLKYPKCHIEEVRLGKTRETMKLAHDLCNARKRFAIRAVKDVPFASFDIHLENDVWQIIRLTRMFRDKLL